MKTTALISIKSKFSTAGGNDTVEMSTLGSFVKMKNAYYITYKEMQESGAEEVITTLKVEGNKRVTMTKRGLNKSHLILERGQRHLCKYDVGPGDVLVGIFAEKIQSDFSDNGVELDLKYTLDVNSDLASRNEINITVKKAGEFNYVHHCH